MGELLFWGYNVSLMVVDHGIDIVANKVNRYFNVQVKTATQQNGAGNFVFTIKKQAFHVNDNSTMFYVLVMRKKLSNDYVVLPSNIIQTMLGVGAVGSGPVLGLSVSVDDKGKRFTLNGSIDINLFINNFGVIR